MVCNDCRYNGFAQCLNSREGVIIFSAIVSLLLTECLDDDTLDTAGNILLTIGQLMVTAAIFE